MRTDEVRAEVQRLIRQTPFRRFLLKLENGDSVVIEHPENIAFDPSEPGANGNDVGSTDFYVISGRQRVFATFDAVSSVSVRDVGGAVGE